MRELKYTASTTGRISIWSEGRKLSEPWHFEPLTLKARRVLRKKLHPGLVRAAWLIFSTRVLPGHVHIVRKSLPLLEQVMQDNAALVPTIYQAICDQHLKAKPATSAVQRLKAIVCASGVSVSSLYERNPYGCQVATPKALRLGRRNEVIRFWTELHWRNETPLTPAGWRYFQRQPAAFHRALGSLEQAAKMFAGFNLLGEQGVDAAPLEFARLVDQVIDDTHASESGSALCLVSAWKHREMISTALTRQQIHLLRDWWYDEKPEIAAGTKWETLVARATQASLLRTTMDPRDLRRFSWPAPIEAFVTQEAMVVTPLVSGVELLEEGQAMDNCLKNTQSYVQRGMQGRSQVFRVQGGQARGTIEMVRANSTDSWSLAQAEAASNQPLTHLAVTKAIREIELRMNAANGVSS